MVDFWIELRCPSHGLERYKIKVVKKFNVPSRTIIPQYQSRPRPGELRGLVIGRYVGDGQAQKYLVEYFKRKGMWEKVLSLKLMR